MADNNDDRMNVDWDETVAYSSADERRRRLTQVRRMMNEHGYDVLVVCGRGDLRYRGRVFYVSDVCQISGDAFVVVPSEGDPVFVNTPVVGLGQAKRTTWASEFRMSARPGHEIAQVVTDLGCGAGTVGVVGLADTISHADLTDLTESLNAAHIVDASRPLDDIRRVKSSEEIGHLKLTSDVFRKVFSALEAEIRPGVAEGDILAQGARLCRLHGCKEIKAAGATTPFGAVSYGSPKPVRPNGITMVWIETPGPTGYWLELRRCYTLGRSNDRVRRFWDAQVQAYAAGVDAARPGATLQDVADAIANPLKRHGVQLAPTYSIHGIGADAIEGSWFPGNDRPLLENEVLSLHPSLMFDDPELAKELQFVGITDNVLVTAAGGVRMTYERDELIAL